MSIRDRLALQFMLLASLVLGTAFVVVYMLSVGHRVEQFTDRMRDRGTNAAKLLIQVEEVDEDLLARIEQDNPVRLPEESIHIHDHQDSLLFRLDHEVPQQLPPGLLDRVRLEDEVYEQQGATELLAFVFNDRYERFVVVVSGNDIYGKGRLRNLSRVLLITFLVGTLLTFLIGRFYAQRALAPVKRLVRDIRTISVADLSRRVEVGNEHDELAQLAASFNDLLMRLQEAFLVQRNFIANASHEIRTPLATIMGQLEVLLLKQRSAADYETSIRSVLEDARNLNHLTDRLLLLAQAGSDALVTSFNPVRMDEVLWAARSEAVRSASGAQVEVDIQGVEEEEDMLVHGNENLLRSLVANLMENACKYSDDHRALVELKAGEDVVTITVKDRGMGIAPEEQERVFEPFYRARHDRHIGGHGIGLSLVRMIARLHGGAVELRSTPGEGSTFTVRLPKAA